MREWSVRGLQVVLVLLLGGSVFVQTVMMTLLAIDLDEEFDGDLAGRRIPIIAIAVLGIVAVQVVLVCVWRLVTMVRAGTVFSDAAFRFVDIVLGAIVAAAVLVFAMGVVLAPGEGVAPGGILLLGGLGVAVLGVALVVAVLRALLGQAVARDVEATQLQAELAQVI